jgi:hypothetical protein
MGFINVVSLVDLVGLVAGRADRCSIAAATSSVAQRSAIVYDQINDDQHC